MVKQDKRFDGHEVTMFLDEDEDWLAYLVDMPNVSAFGVTAKKALDELAEAWELVKESQLADGKK